MIKAKHLLVLAFLYGCATFSFGQEVATRTAFEVLKNSNSPNLRLLTEVDSLIHKKREEYVADGSVWIMAGADTLEILPARINVRGKFRRMKCDFPPLKIDFRKKGLRGAGFREIDDYKLVTHCLSDERLGAELLYREHLCYLLLEKLTPLSFQSIILPVTYIDASSMTETKSVGILLESNEELAIRLQGDWCNCLGTEPTQVDAFHFELVRLFQYMIGNSDMNLTTEHNIKLLNRTEGPKLPVIYDFDYSRFVAAPYAPGGESIFQPRVYACTEGNMRQCEEVRALLLKKRKELFTTIKSYTEMKPAERARATQYLSGFYAYLRTMRF